MTVRSPALEPPPGNPRFPLFDGIRALAILLVVACHSAELSGATSRVSWGWLGLSTSAGVLLFFAVSGFLLYRPYASAHAGLRQAPRVRDFARRRVLRILPAYWVAITVLAIWPGIPGVFSGKWWAYYGLAQSYSNTTVGSGDPVAWSLCTEVGFYLGLPLLAAAVALAGRHVWRRSLWLPQLALLIPLAAVGVVFATLAQQLTLPSWVGNTLAGNTQWFVIGMLLAVFSVELERRGTTPRVVAGLRERGALAWLGAAVVFVAGSRAFDIFGQYEHWGRAGPASVPVYLAHQAVIALCVVLVLIPALVGSGGLLRRVLARGPVAYVGLISYGIFLWHMPLLAWLANYHWPPDPIPGTSGGLEIQRYVPLPESLTLFVSILLFSGLIAAASYHFVELPFLRLKERPLFRRRRGLTAPGVPLPAEGEAVG
jgi:peptidoglycan/LPS O-acetylase OafA/YrhL